MAIRTGSGAGNPGKKGRVTAGLASLGKQGQAARPLRPTEDSFPSKGEFRLGHYKVLEERDDYLICIGFDPNAKDPFAHITPSARRKIKVAKPYILRRTPWDGESVTLGGTTYTYAYSDTEYGVRTATWTDSAGVQQEEEQRIYIPYTVDDEENVIVAIQTRENAAVDGLDVDDEDGGRLTWIDLNDGGRHWRSEADSSSETTETRDTSTRCSADNCLDGTAMPASSTVCCESHPSWEFDDTWTSEVRSLNWTTGNVWLSDAFDGPEDSGGLKNEYKWKLTVSATIHASILELVLETDNGAAVECIKYLDEHGFQCLCANSFRLSVWENVSREDLTTTVCVNPNPAAAVVTGEVCGFQVTPAVKLVVSGMSATAEPGPCEAGDCLLLEGEHSLYLRETYTDQNGDLSGAKYEGSSSGCPGSDDLTLTIGYNCSGANPNVCGFISFGVAPCHGTCCADLQFGCCGTRGAFTLTGGNAGFGYPIAMFDSFHCGGTFEVYGLSGSDAFVSPTDDGGCAGCTTDAAPADAAGACCIGVECLDVSEADCTTLSGTWHATDAECEAACSVDGACCVEIINGGHNHYCYNLAGEGHCDEFATVFAHLGTVTTKYYPGQFCNFTPGHEEDGIDCDTVIHSPSSSPSSSPSATGSSSPSASPSSSPSSSTSSSPSSSPSGADPTGCCESFVSSPCSDGYTEADCDAESGVWCEDGTCTPGGCSCP